MNKKTTIITTDNIFIVIAKDDNGSEWVFEVEDEEYLPSPGINIIEQHSRKKSLTDKIMNVLSLPFI